MKKINTILGGATALTFGLLSANAQTIGSTAQAVVNGAGSVVSGTANVAKGVAGSAVSGVKGLASLPGKAFSIGDGSLPNLTQGTQEFGIAGNVQFGGDIQYNLDVSYGYFFKDNWEVGFEANIQGADEQLTLGVGLFTEYNFDLDSKWVPFVGASVGLATLSTEDGGSASVSDDVTSLALGGVFGVKYFVRENFAISASVDFQWSPDDVFGGLGDASEAASNVNIGTRFYF